METMVAKIKKADTTLQGLIHQHGQELGEAMWWCAIANGEAVLEVSPKPDVLLVWSAKSYLDWDWR